ncbi:FAD-binding-3 domain-containing protein [Mycena indigotica]|uniref:FAD-binding-3 domain-containing protein n=1 Tax=Mycena indigotica TaxID=2126181 RepID=A0A8H6T5Y7_9AGAR|nr:FAD-binding-3 domain-containing protein [Mycena indigotica]KAF7312695.1 FAD-binding-3 domain-containing protein [Mycena indigotica]
MTGTGARPLNVTVVGAGIGGLAVAAALRKCGHVINVYESFEVKTEIGAGVGMQSNAVRVLKSLGYKRENLKGGIFDGMTIHNAETAKFKKFPTRNWDSLRKEGLENFSCHRGDLHAELLRLATEKDAADGPPAKLHFGNKVVSCDPEAATITLANGETVTSDLVIGADGIHSIVRTSVLGKEVQAEPTGWACYRCMFDASNINDHPEFDWVLKNMNTIRQEGSQLAEHIVYGVRGSTLINFVAFDSHEGRDTKRPIAQPATKEEIWARYPTFHEKFRHLFDLPLATPVLRWELRALPLLPTWIKGRAAIIGDAAHATLPLLGQGAGLALEEADQVPARLAAFQDLRKERGEFVNVQSVAQADPEYRVKFTKTSWDEQRAKRAYPGPVPSARKRPFQLESLLASLHFNKSPPTKATLS